MCFFIFRVTIEVIYFKKAISAFVFVRVRLLFLVSCYRTRAELLERQGERFQAESSLFECWKHCVRRNLELSLPLSLSLSLSLSWYSLLNSISSGFVNAFNERRSLSSLPALCAIVQSESFGAQKVFSRYFRFRFMH